jgi:hypothetical protein
VVGFFSTYRNQYPVSRDVLREIADQFHNWVKNRSERWGAPVLDAPEGTRIKLCLVLYCTERSLSTGDRGKYVEIQHTSYARHMVRIAVPISSSFFSRRFLSEGLGPSR